MHRGAQPEPAVPVGFGRCGGQAGHLAFGPGLQDLAVDVVAAALARDQVALVDQRLVGEDHRVAGDAEGLGELAAGGQAAARRKPAVEDRGDQAAAHLGLEAVAAVGAQMEMELGHAAWLNAIWLSGPSIAWGQTVRCLRFALSGPGPL